jgi:Rrf2 family transcriptional regulator, cysteine metabolism repressor
VKLSSALTYAINATVELARSEPNRRVTARELARRGDMPERFLLQILGSLASSGILHSFPGVTGGYTLSRPPGKITLLDIIESVEVPSDPLSHAAPNVSSDIRRRVEITLAATWQAARFELNKLTIADLVGREMEQSESTTACNSPK